MSAFRHCCRHPRAESPDLPNFHLVPSPTQDDGYDADAIPIPTPAATLVGGLHPTAPDEPRPSSDTIVHHEVIQRTDKKVDGGDNESVSPSSSKSLMVQRINSISIPRRRSHAQAQPLLSPSTAALDNYVKISPSRAALRKRLEAVKVIDDSERPPSPKLEPVRIASIPESVVSPQWRLSYRENSSSFRRPGLKEVIVDEHQKEANDEGGSSSNSSKIKVEPEVHQNNAAEKAPATSENERLGHRAPVSDGGVNSQTIRKHGATVSGDCRLPGSMPGSYHSDSTASSVHLYNMQISERVASSNSNILSMEGSSLGRRRASTTGSSPLLPVGMLCNKHDRQSSGLQSPKESSSVYSSDGQDLASSRRSSILLIQGLPERISRLKSHVTTGDLYSTSAQHSLITVIPRSRFPTTFTDEGRQGEPDGIGSLSDEAEVEQEDSDDEKTRSPPLRRSSTEPRLNRFKRDAPASFDGSGEWHLSPPARAQTGRLQRQATNLLYTEDAASAWERALREHAEEDKAILKARAGSISYEIGRDDLKRRARSRRFTRTPSPLGNITEDPWSQARGRETGPASGRVSPTQVIPSSPSKTQQGSPNRDVGGQPPSRAASSSTRSVDSWTRYPSHTFRERTEAANAKDNVITRDFAIGHSPERKISKKKSRSMTFGKSMLHKIGRLYKTRSSDFRRYHAGHRSSISVGGVLEYPELEIPRPSFDPILLSGPRDSSETEESSPERALKEAAATPMPSSPQHPSPSPSPSPQNPSKREETASSHTNNTKNPIRPRLDAVDWARAYDDCVVRPRNTDSDEEIAPDEVAPPESRSEVELDRRLRKEVEMAMEEALRAADECWRKSGEIERFVKKG
ncbi:MAG: hypothetical protein Q9201_002739 [Fulgogasparrea decipioides]